MVSATDSVPTSNKLKKKKKKNWNQQVSSSQFLVLPLCISLWSICMHSGAENVIVHPCAFQISNRWMKTQQNDVSTYLQAATHQWKPGNVPQATMQQWPWPTHTEGWNVPIAVLQWSAAWTGPQQCDVTVSKYNLFRIDLHLSNSVVSTWCPVYIGNSCLNVEK